MRKSQIARKLREHANHIEAKYNNTQEVCHDLRVAATKLEELVKEINKLNDAIDIATEPGSMRWDRKDLIEYVTTYPKRREAK